MEFLSKQFNQSQGIANLVLQSPESVRNGFDAAGTHGYKIQHLPFRPDEQFHEYRFDWSSDRIVFYIDGDLTYEMTEFLPTSGGHMFMNHWSNGDPLWSAGPPAQGHRPGKAAAFAGGLALAGAPVTKRSRPRPVRGGGREGR